MKDIDVQELKLRLDQNEELIMIDIREVHERDEYHLGGEHILMGDLMTRAPEMTYDKDDEIIVYCNSGNRSQMGKQVLEMHGFTKVRHLEGGIVAWQEAFDPKSD